MLAVQQLLRHGESAGLPTEEILNQCRRDSSDFSDYGISPDIPNLKRIVDTIARIGPPGVGFDLGLQWDCEDFKPFDAELQLCGSLAEMSALIKRFNRTVPQTSLFRDTIVGDEWILEFLPSVPAGPGVIVLMEEMLARTCKTREYFSGQMFRRIELAYPAPSHSRKYEELFQCRVMFGRPRTLISLDREYLHCPLEHSGAEAKADRCIESDIAGEFRTRQCVTLAILETLLFHPGCYPSLQRVAEMFDTSPSTLKRRLASEGINYRQLVDVVRSERVAQYLSLTELAPKAIAYQLGFANVHNFRRAYHRWMGMTPTQFRICVRNAVASLN